MGDEVETTTGDGQEAGDSQKTNATGTEAGDNNGQKSGQAGTAFATFDDWYREQPKEIQSLHDAHVAGLRSALDSERESRKKIGTALDELKAKVALIPELQKQAALVETLQRQIQDVNTNLSSAGEERDFYIAAHAAGVEDLGLAWLAVQRAGDSVRDRKGNVDFDLVKEKHPNLFARPQSQRPATTNAGRGVTNNNAPAPVGMDKLIRRQAGRD